MLTDKKPVAKSKPRTVCERCDSTEWVCENHEDRPWRGFSDRKDACECGAGAPCPLCNPLHGQ